MKYCIRFIVPVVAIIFVSCGTQRYPVDDRRDGNYGNVLSNDGGYYDHGYNTAGWYDLDRVKVAARNDQKRIKVTRREGKNVSQLLFRTDGPVNIKRVTAKFSNGQTEELDLRNDRYDKRRRNSDFNHDLIVRVSDYSRARLKEINFWYEVNNRNIFSRRPTVSVFAR